jgi:RsiW-degrading membrane proteinase PrsW (M82 family)
VTDHRPTPAPVARPAQADGRPPLAQHYAAPDGLHELPGNPRPQNAAPPRVEHSAQDRRLAIAGGTCAAVSICGVAAELLGLVPSAVAATIVVAAAGIGLRLVVRFLARSASASSRSRVLKIVSSVGLAVSGAVAIGSLPVATHAGGMGRFMSDLLALLWALALLTVSAGPVRTMGWRAFVGTGLTGFLALTALARLVGRPIVNSLGTNSVLATSVWVPLTEELCKALPVVLIVVFAARRRASRPSAIDLALLGAWAGAGYALYEDTQFGRGGAHWSAAPPFSLLFPSEDSFDGSSVSFAVGGHQVWTALLGLGLGVGVLYRRRFRRAWLAVPLTFATVLIEHGATNAALGTGSPSALNKVLLALTLNGWLSSILLVGGIGIVLRIEWRVLRGTSRPAEWWILRPQIAAGRSQSLAVAQAGPPAQRPSQPAPQLGVHS